MSEEKITSANEPAAESLTTNTNNAASAENNTILSASVSDYLPQSEKNQWQEQQSSKSTAKLNNNFSYKKLLTIALICSLLGGIVGGGLVLALMPESSGGGSQTTIQVAGDVSPVTAIAEANMPTVVSIVNTSTTTYSDFLFGRNYTQESTASGSGVIITADGYIATNYHVIENASKLTVTLYDGRVFDAQIIGGDEATDLAVIKIDADDLAYATMGDSDELRVGDLVVAIGNPLDAQAFAWTVTDGIVSGLGRTIETDGQSFTLIQTNAAINAGNSGGALLNANGELIGINSMKLTGDAVEGMGFAIPINDAKPILEQLISQGYVSRPYLGISGYDITDSLLGVVSLKRDNGILITQLTEDGPAETAGVQVGDIIYAVDGENIASFDELSAIISEHQVGDTLSFSINRNGSEITLDITLGEQGTKLELKATPEKTTNKFSYFFAE